MRITERQLRSTIRRILKEGSSQNSRVINKLVSKNVSDVRQAFSMGVRLGLLDDISKPHHKNSGGPGWTGYWIEMEQPFFNEVAKHVGKRGMNVFQIGHMLVDDVHIQFNDSMHPADKPYLTAMLKGEHGMSESRRRQNLIENASHEDKLATMIGSLDPASIVQALNLGESIGLVEEYEEYSRSMYDGDLVSFNALVKRSFAKKIEAAIQSNPNPSISQPYMDNRNYELIHYDEDTLPPFTHITVRVKAP